MSTRRMRAGARRSQIIEAAAEVFSKYGFEGATTARLAAAAGISEPILYRHFDDKEQLFCTVLDWSVRSTLEIWETAISGISSTREQLLAIAGIMPSPDARESRQGVLLAAQAACHQPGIRSALTNAYNSFEEFVTSLIKQGQQAGELRRDIHPQSAAWALLSLGLASRLIYLLNLPVAKDAAWAFGAGSRYLDTIT